MPPKMKVTPINSLVFYRWINKGDDLVEAIDNQKLQYTRFDKTSKKSVPSKKACWVFQLGNKKNSDGMYHPSGDFSKRILIKIELKTSIDKIVEADPKFEDINESTDFGESDRPDSLIIKSGAEYGAIGIGRNVLNELDIKQISLASKEEIARAKE